jgi:mannose-1-phosphate guanylyltransferase
VGFGYIKSGEILNIDGAPEARDVIKFVEKPNIAKARKYVDSGQYLWNAGMFIAPAKLLLEQLAKSEPALHASIMELAAAWDTDNRKSAIERIWPGLKKVAIDYSVAEPAAAAGLVAVIPASFSWHDVTLLQSPNCSLRAVAAIWLCLAMPRFLPIAPVEF